jgi:hypothetical protein
MENAFAGAANAINAAMTAAHPAVRETTLLIE